MGVIIPLHLSHPGPGILVELVLLLCDRLELLDNTAECLLAGTTLRLRIYRSFPTTFGLGSERLDERKTRRVQPSTCVPCAIIQGRVTQ